MMRALLQHYSVVDRPVRAREESTSIMANTIDEEVRNVRELQTSTSNRYTWVAAIVFGRNVDVDTFVRHSSLDKNSEVGRIYQHRNLRTHTRLMYAARNTSREDPEHVAFARGYRAIIDLLQRAPVSFVSYNPEGRYDIILAFDCNRFRSSRNSWNSAALWDRTRVAVNTRINSRDEGDGPSIRITGQQLYNLAGSINHLSCSPREYRGSSDIRIHRAAITADPQRPIPAAMHGSPVERTLFQHTNINDSVPPSKMSNGWAACDTPALQIDLPEL